jgi:phenylalanyl-tRNA synthetase alpha chain
VLSVGRVFRQDRQDRRHTRVFHQLDFVYIDRGATMATLRETLEHLFHEVLGPVETRWRRGILELVQEPQVFGVKSNSSWVA